MDDTIVFLLGLVSGFMASALGSVLMWLIFGPYIVGREVDNSFEGLKEGEYDEMIKEVTVKAVNSILEDPHLKKQITGMLHAYAMNFSKQAADMLQKMLMEKFGIDPQRAQQMVKSVGGGGFNPDAIIGKVLNSIFPD